MKFVLIIVCTLLCNLNAFAANVVATIKPLHSLVQAVMGDTGEAVLLINNNATPHGFKPRPSQQRSLQNADIVFYIDDSLETFMPRIRQSLPDTVQTLALMEQPGLALLALRDASHWQTDGNHDHGRYDPHVWLNPANATAMAIVIATRLAQLDPVQEGVYRENLDSLLQRITRLDEELAVTLASIADKPFVVLHDAFQYFEHQFRLNAMGSVSMNPSQPVSVKQYRDILRMIRDEQILCIFREPQQPGKLIDAIAFDSGIRTGLLDPLGAGFPPGARLYFELMRELAASLKECLGQTV